MQNVNLVTPRLLTPRYGKPEPYYIWINGLMKRTSCPGQIIDEKERDRGLV